MSPGPCRDPSRRQFGGAGSESTHMELARSFAFRAPLPARRGPRANVGGAEAHDPDRRVSRWLSPPGVQDKSRREDAADRQHWPAGAIEPETTQIVARGEAPCANRRVRDRSRLVQAVSPNMSRFRVCPATTHSLRVEEVKVSRSVAYPIESGSPRYSVSIGRQRKMQPLHMDEPEATG